jgi:hypothetical protein
LRDVRRMRGEENIDYADNENERGIYKGVE